MTGIPSEDMEFTLRCVAHGPIGMITRPTVGVRKHQRNTRSGGLRQLLGEICVYYHVLRYHELRPSTPPIIMSGITRRSIDAIDRAFAAGYLSCIRPLAKLVPSEKRSWKLKLKLAIAALPPAINRPAAFLVARGRFDDFRGLSPGLQKRFHVAVEYLS